MAITISGSGIVEANIADGAVSSDKLATGIDATKLADGTVTSTELQYINTLASNAQTQISGVGGVALQVVSNHVTSTSSQTITIATIANVTNMSCAITPASTDSKILIQVAWTGEEANNSDNSTFSLKRDTTEIASPAQTGIRSFGMSNASNSDENGSSPSFVCLQFIDSPATTSEVTYYLTYRDEYAGTTLYNNRTVVDGNATGYERLTSSIILTELSAASTLTNGA